jgi:ABC-type Fe3+-hydroxamate transport system substrate-binding protein
MTKSFYFPSPFFHTVKVYSPEVGFVDLPDNPERIVCLSPAVTETLFMLGVGNRLVGVDSWSYRPKEALKIRRVGSYATLNEEVVRELSPDLVITTTGVQRSMIERLKSMGIAVYPIPVPTTIFELISAASTVGGLVGAYQEGLELSRRLLQRLNSLLKMGLPRPARVYVEIDLGGPTIPAYFSHVTSAMHLLNMINVYGNVKQAYLYGMKVEDFPIFSVEDVFRADPDVVIYEFKRKQFSREEVEGLIQTRGWDRLRAVREGRLIVLPSDTLAHHGPSFMDNMEDCLIKVRESLGLTSPSHL